MNKIEKYIKVAKALWLILEVENACGHFLLFDEHISRLADFEG